MSTGVFRFDFQNAAVAHAKGIVLNVGCNEDPAGLRARWGTKVVNCDLEAWDSTMDRPNPVDEIFDASKFPWPFGDQSVHTVILGDILEHFPYDVMVDVLKETKRVAKEVCVTIPEDTRVNEQEMAESYTAGKYNLHTIIATEDVVRKALNDAGWTPYIFTQSEWGFDDGQGNPIMGWCVMANHS